LPFDVWRTRSTSGAVSGCSSRTDVVSLDTGVRTFGGLTRFPVLLRLKPQAWEDSLPGGKLPAFHSLAGTVHRHFDDIFAYWDAPVRTSNAYTECLNGLIKVANRMGRGYSYEIIRAKTLYAKHARTVGGGTGAIASGDSTKPSTKPVEYGPYIPTLVDSSETGVRAPGL